MGIANASTGPRAPGSGVRAFRAGKLGDAVFHALTFAFVLLVLAAIIAALAQGGWPALSKLKLGFFVSATWNPVTETFGALAPIYGTIVTSVIALLFGVPVSLGIVIVLTELAPV